MKALITGAGGFLGSAIARALLDRGDQVQGLSRVPHPEVECLGVRMVQGDIADFETVNQALQGVEVVFHVAAKAGVWGPLEEYHRTNVEGTRNVIAACKANGIKRLVYTSTPSVVYSGQDEEGLDESAPYVERPLCHYAATKMVAERDVLLANGEDLATVALRPHLIWGPGDNNLVPRLVSRARAGRLRLVGSGRNLVDSVYIDNAALAHLQAAVRLAPGEPCAGRVYFITNGEPLPMGDLINRILEAAGLPPVTKRVPAWFAYLLGASMEWYYRLRKRDDEPLMTRFVARQLATAHWYDLTAARRDLGYHPFVSISEGLERLARYLASDGGEQG